MDGRAENASSPSLRPEEVLGLRVMNGVSREAVWGMLEHCPLRSLAAGEFLLRRGENNSVLYLVLEGRLRVHLGGSTEDTLAVLEPGVMAGELSVLDGSPVSADVVAELPSRLLAVTDATFWRMVRASHEFAANLLLMMGQRMRHTNTTVQTTVEARRHFERVSHVDALTGLRNRRWLEENLQRLVDRERRGGRAVSVVMVDLDHFKLINDRLGHGVGDDVLRMAGRVILSRMRPTDLPVRYGGEEMLLLLPGTDLDGACAAAERLRKLLAANPFSTAEGEAVQVTASLGVAQVHEAENPVDAIQRADAALYRAKHAGRNRVERSA